MTNKLKYELWSDLLVQSNPGDGSAIIVCNPRPPATNGMPFAIGKFMG